MESYKNGLSLSKLESMLRNSKENTRIIESINKIENGWEDDDKKKQLLLRDI